MKKTIMLIAGGVLVVLSSVLVTLFATGTLTEQDENPPNAEAEASAEEHQMAADPKDLIYVPLGSAFTLGFQDSATAKFLQFDLEVAVDGKDAEEAIDVHGPAIRNGLVLLLSNLDANELQTRAGKEELRKQIRDEIRSTLESLTGEPGVVDAYFTSFLMQ